MNEVVIPLKIQGIAQMKAELRELKGSIASATDPAQMAALAQQAGVLSDKIKDANDAVAVFASGSKFEQVSNGIGGIKDSLMSLDFEEAAEKSKTFATALGGLSKNDISKSLKGMTETAGTLGKAFLKLGAQILINPIFYIPIIIAAIVAAIVLVLKSFGVLDDVIKALMAPINALIQGFKDMTDWLGLTAYAAEENAEKTLAANEKVVASSDARTARVTGDLGREIAEAKAAGEDTTKLEEELSNTKIKEANKRKQSAKEALDAQKKLGDDADLKKIEDLKKQVAKENEIIKQGYSDKTVAKNTADKKESDDADKKEKEASDKAKVARDKRIAADKASEADIAAAAKVVSDSKKTAQQVELDDLAAAYKKKIDEATKHKNDITALVEAQEIQTKAINKKYADEAAAKKVEDDAKTAANMASSHAANIAKIDAYNAELAALTDTEEQKLYDKYEADKIKFADNELALFNLKKKYEEDTTALKKTEADKQKVIDDAAHAEKMKNIEAGFKLTQSVGEAIAFMADTNITAQLKKVKKGSKEEEVLLKKQFEQNKKAQLAAAIINAAQAQVSILAQYPKFDGGFAMVAAMAGAAITSAMAIGKITAASFSGGGSTPDSPDSSLTSTTAVAPAAAPQLFGQANTGSQVNAGGSTNNITVTAIVSETEITSSQNHINNIQNNSVL
jgi:hypothetical protein